MENPKVRKEPSVDKLPPGFQSTFLDGLTPPEIKILLKAAKQETVALKQVIERGGDPATRMWLLFTGRVAVYKLAENGKKLFLGWRVPGDTFGVQTILRDPARYILTIEAVQESSILAWDLPSSRALVLRCPGLSNAAMRVATGYFDDLIDVLGTFAFQAQNNGLPECW